MVSDGVTYETTFRIAPQVEQVNNKKVEKQVAKGKQASTREDNSVDLRISSRPIISRKHCLWGGMKGKKVFKKKGQPSGYTTSNGSYTTTPQVSKGSTGSDRFSSSGSWGGSFEKQ
ncbi:hypothetical protein C1H46_012290 [Malus baccata]|uniref:Uncharacterized protein n=1 Tax=Malus baccata TaxID=106549 RepID=A0A540MTI4_MALBA|nr:hypothetical protein C1H46_012290 [Malus baccata]